MSKKKFTSSEKFSGSFLRALRKQLKLTQKEFADPLSIGGAYVSDIERGNSVPSESVIREIVSHYQVNRFFLESGREPMFLKEEPSQSTMGNNTMCSPSDQHDLEKERINLTEGRLMTDLVLMSGTQYAEALWSNLKSFAEAVRKEEQVKELERKVDDGFKQSATEIAELKEMIRALGGVIPEKKSKVA